MINIKIIDGYMKRSYKLRVTPKKDFNHTEYFVATYEELEGLEGVGETEIEAIQDLNIAKEIWFKVMLENQEEIPMPES